MSKLRYFPLVDIEPTGTYKVPMFPTADEAMAASRFKAYLEECGDSYFMLHRKTDYAVQNIIRCPRCGKEMDCLTSFLRSVRNPVYACRDCLKAVKACRGDIDPQE